MNPRLMTDARGKLVTNGTTTADVVPIRCPECGHDAADIPPIAGRDGTGKLLLCDHCAAISTWDKTRYRPLVTQEWCDLVLDPRFYPVMERRGELVEKMTAPPAGIGKGKGASGG